MEVFKIQITETLDVFVTGISADIDCHGHLVIYDAMSGGLGHVAFKARQWLCWKSEKAAEKQP